MVAGMVKASRKLAGSMMVQRMVNPLPSLSTASLGTGARSATRVAVVGLRLTPVTNTARTPMDPSMIPPRPFILPRTSASSLLSTTPLVTTVPLLGMSPFSRNGTPKSPAREPWFGSRKRSLGMPLLHTTFGRIISLCSSYSPFTAVPFGTICPIGGPLSSKPSSLPCGKPFSGPPLGLTRLPGC